jgi:hypothetical protein
LKKQSLENAARAFSPGIGKDAERTMQKVMDDLSGKIGQFEVTPLIV